MNTEYYEASCLYDAFKMIDRRRKVLAVASHSNGSWASLIVVYESEAEDGK